PLRGVMAGRDSMSLRVALPELPPDLDEDGEFDLLLAPDETSRLRQKAALDRAARETSERFIELRAVLLGSQTPRFAIEEEFRPGDSGLNASQLEASRFALSGKD